MWQTSSEFMKTQETFEFLPDICHLLIDTLLFQFTHSRSTNVRNELEHEKQCKSHLSTIEVTTYLREATHAGRHLGRQPEAAQQQ